jgi:hypothetical protein
MTEPEIGSYRDAEGLRHKLIVRQTPEGEWHVLDIDLTSDAAHVVDALVDEQDGRPQAEAVARDYLTTVGGLETGTGPAAAEPIPEQGGTDARSSDRSPHPAARVRRPRGAALSRPAL